MAEREIQKKYRRESVASVKIRRSVYDEMVDFSERMGYSQTDIVSYAVKQYMAAFESGEAKAMREIIK